jgi:hypothetical protein
MDGHRFAALMNAAITPGTADRAALTRLTATCWPGRDDRTVPVGRNWVKLWGPRPMTAAPHRCVAERCGFCN